MNAGKTWSLLVLLGVAAAACESSQAEMREAKDTETEKDPALYDGRTLGRQMRTVDAFLARGEVKQKEEFVASAEANPNLLPAKFLKAYAVEDRRLAWKELDVIRKSFPGVALGYLGQLAIYADWKMLDEALKIYEQLKRLDANLATAHARMGNLYAARAQNEKAAELYQLALKLDPADGDALLGLARQKRTAGAKDDALGLYEKGAGEWPENLALLKERAELMEELGQRKEAAQAWIRAARLERRPYDILMRAAALWAQEGDKVNAEEVYKQALLHNPTDPGLLTTLGQMAAERGDREAQRAYFSRAVEGRPDDLDIQRVLAQGYLDKGESAGAERHLLEVVRLAPEDQGAQLALARIYTAANKYRETYERYQAAAAAGPLTDDAAKEYADWGKKLLLGSGPPPSGKNVNKVFEAALKPIMAAYEQRLKAVPTLKGALTVEVDVGEDGTVKSVKLKDDTMADEILAANIYFTLKGAKFPAGERKRYSYPMTFAGRGKKGK